ncbi:hypothetical protein V6N12_064324 [Hibiscus sabdariffa]|uniref:Calcineurin-like phosphoesterase domain-containing protein n=1 Tax=Hibiscus sabdariffa TaxID=183260 RepID=A0ABR2G5H9_9ROSI
MKPDFLDMVPWYSGTSADMFNTVFDLLVSVTLFVGRGDGGNSSYAVARLLAQPSLQLTRDDSVLSLSRGDLLLIGGDLAYPNPSGAVNKAELSEGIHELKEYNGPQWFLIPGNHDWFILVAFYTLYWFSLRGIPQCKLDHILQDDSFSDHLRSFFGTVWSAFVYVLEHSFVSLVGLLILLTAAIVFVPSKLAVQ